MFFSNHKKLVGWLLTTALVASACGGSGEDPAVASLEDGEVATLADAADAAVIPDEDETEDDPEAAALAFSQCMRDEGLDFPDLGVDAEGNINIREGFEAFDRSDESFRQAREACQGELAAGGFGGGRREALQDPEVQDALVAFSDCIRDQGFDVGDLTLGQGGQGQPGQQGQQGQQNQDQDQGQQDNEATADDEATAGDPPEGRREGGFGNRNSRFAQQLGLDSEDPAVVEALETCSPIIDEAFTNAGVGQPSNG